MTQEALFAELYSTERGAHGVCCRIITKPHPQKSSQTPNQIPAVTDGTRVVFNPAPTVEIRKLSIRVRTRILEKMLFSS